MKAFIGRYYKTAEAAIEDYEKLSDGLKEMQSIVEVGNRYFIVGNSTINAFNVA